MSTLKITIDKIGRPTIKAEGFQGTACKEASQPYEDKFAVAGGQAPITQYAPEYSNIGDDNTEGLQQTV